MKGKLGAMVSKSTLISSDVNFFGKSRPMVIGVLFLIFITIIGAVRERNFQIGSDINQNLVVRLGFYAVISFAMSIVVTIEHVARLLFSVIVGSLVGFLASFAYVASLRVIAISFGVNSDLTIYFVVGSIIITLASIVIAKMKLNDSKILGYSCISCQKRGSINSAEVEKQFIGQVMKTEHYSIEKRERRAGDNLEHVVRVPMQRVVPYNQYRVHIVENCKNCSDTAERWVTREAKS